jgi:CRP-like cAMP-binding protein
MGCAGSKPSGAEFDGVGIGETPRASSSSVIDRQLEILMKAKQKKSKRKSLGAVAKPEWALAATQAEMSDSVLRSIVTTFRGHFLMADLADDVLHAFSKAMVRRQVAAGEVVMREGEEGDYFYCVERGEFVCTNSSGDELSRIGPGGYFGELAIILKVPRTATVTCSAEVQLAQASEATGEPELGEEQEGAAPGGVLWALDRVTLRTKLRDTMGTDVDTVVSQLSSIPLFQPLSSEQKAEVAQRAQAVHFPAGSRILARGDHGEIMYAITAGVVACENKSDSGKQVDTRLLAGAVFGEGALLAAVDAIGSARVDSAAGADAPKPNVRGCDVRALTDTSCLAFDKGTFTEHLAAPLRGLLDRSHRIKVLRALKFLGALDDDSISSLADSCDLRHYRADEAIMRQGDLGDEFFVLQSGTCRILKEAEGAGDVEIDRIGPGDYFGEMALQGEEHGAGQEARRRAATVRVAQDSEGGASCFVFGRSRFRAFMQDLQTIRSGTVGHQTNLAMYTSGLELADLDVKGKLGRGGYSAVKLVRHKESQAPYALKVMNKAHLREKDQMANVISEREVLRLLNGHPFIMRLAGAMCDDENEYFVLELCLGGELFAYLHGDSADCADDAISVSDTRFFSACVAEAIGHMHSKNVAYRDLKPENLLIDETGYIKIIDMGFAKVLTGRTFTICGTAEYLSPETLQPARGHRHEVDLWALGVLIYEMLVGSTPFIRDGSHSQMFKAIAAVDYVPPSRAASGRHPIDEVTDLFVSMLLTKNPRRRLGCGDGGIDTLKQHPWFDGFDWNALLRKKIEAPWIPPLQSVEDNSLFFDSDDEEEDF